MHKRNGDAVFPFQDKTHDCDSPLQDRFFFEIPGLEGVVNFRSQQLSKEHDPSRQ